MKRGAIMVKTYVRKMGIDFFAFPIEKGGNVYIALVVPDMIIQAIENDAPIVERRKGELFYRMRRIYSPVKVLPYLRPVHLIKTNIDKVKNMPEHAGLKARGFEIVVSDTLGAQHTGDKLKAVDVVDTMYGRIECKIGGGRLYWAANK